MIKDRRNIRNWATPLTMSAFTLVAATGIMMFFRFEPGFTRIAHQWVSWALVVGAAGHILANAGPLRHYFNTRWGRATMAACAVLFLASLPDWGMRSPAQLEQPIKRALVNAPLSSLAKLAQTTPSALEARLKADGISARADQSVHKVAESSGTSEAEILALIFIADKGHID